MPIYTIHLLGCVQFAKFSYLLVKGFAWFPKMLAHIFFLVGQLMIMSMTTRI